MIFTPAPISMLVNEVQLPNVSFLEGQKQSNISTIQNMDILNKSGEDMKDVNPFEGGEKVEEIKAQIKNIK